MRREYRKSVKKKVRRRRWKIFIIVVTIIFSLFALAATVAGFILYDKYKPVYDQLQESADNKIASINEGTFKDKTETLIFDNKGNVMAELAIHDYYYIDIEDINPLVIDALISIEDRRYYEHDGFDLKAIIRAGVDIIKNKGEISQGGSTITQQLVKLQFLTLDKTYMRKAEEILIAVRLEDKYDKDEILEFYLNNINYGNGAYGIDTASRKYFSKPSSELTLSEAAFLTAIPNNPSVYNPLRNMENTLKRRDLILSKMYEYGKITPHEYMTAYDEEIVLNVAKDNYVPESYGVSFAISSATKELMAVQGFKFKYWFDSKSEMDSYQEEYNDLFMEINQKIRNGGFNIYTTLDMEKQNQLQDSIDKGLSSYKKVDSESKLYKTQGSGVTIDNETGDVLAIVGGRSQDGVDNTFNRAFLAYRQPGSIIKPFLSYMPAFERGMLSSTVMTDKPIKNGPRNAGGNFRGDMTLREATERSVNTIAYQLVDIHKPKTVLPYLEKMNFAKLVPEDNNLSISLGGFTYGTNTLEMAGAYSTIARNGQYIKPTGITKIVDLLGDTVYENKRERKKVYDSGVSYLMTDVLKGVFTERYATGYGLSLDNMTAAGKSGTTNNRKDVWFAGYTPYYTTVVWVGNDTPSDLGQGSHLTGYIWKDYMNRIHKGLENKDFEMPKDIKYRYVNPKNGEVSEDAKNGWRKELVPDIYYEILLKKKAEEEERRLAEIAKAEAEKKEMERKKAEARAKAIKDLGLTEEEVELQKNEALNAIYGLQYIHVKSRDDYDFVDSQIEIVKRYIDQVQLKEDRDYVTSLFNKEVGKLEDDKNKIESAIKAAEEAEKRAEEEKKRKAEEEEAKRKAEEEAQRKAEEEAKKKAEEEAKKKAEEEKNNKEQKEEENNKEQKEEENIEDDSSIPGGSSEGNEG